VAGALIGFVGSSAAGLGAQWFAERRERASAEREEVREHRRREEARLEELRGVLDDAALAMTQLVDAYSRAEHLARHHHAEPPEQDEPVFWEYHNALRAAWRQQTRLEVRLGGDHPVPKSYLGALKVQSDERRALMGLRYLPRHARELEAETAQGLIADRDAAFKLQDEFHREAARLIGPSPAPSQPS
jgi:hypothetical protein